MLSLRKNLPTYGTAFPRCLPSLCLFVKKLSRRGGYWHSVGVSKFYSPIISDTILKMGEVDPPKKTLTYFQTINERNSRHQLLYDPLQ